MTTPMRPIQFCALALAMVACASAARADDQPFLTLDATDIEPELGREIEQSFQWNSGLSDRAFQDLEGQTEFEYGWSDRMQVGLATSYSWSYEHDHLTPPVSSLSTGQWGGIAGEAIYQAMNVYFDPIGLGFLVSAKAGPSERTIEALVLMQKNFVNDRLRIVVNGGGSFGSKKNGIWSDAGALTFNAGVAYNITWDFSAALEFNAEHDFDGLLINGRGAPTTTGYYFGPTLQYVALPWRATLGLQTQLPWGSDAAHAPGSVEHGYLADAERLRIELRVTRSFY
ncbi:MAG TPA: hypothetical protein VHC42_09545 [Rhizomicrobium sp.]|nr:hypothetical protein [Rhizomicrobium sp.]